MSSYTKEQAKDEEVLACIIAGAEASGRKMDTSFDERAAIDGADCGSGLGFGEIPDGPCCAVGAGIIFAGLPINDQTAPETFAGIHGVSVAYANGVSDGFEALTGSGGDSGHLYEDGNDMTNTDADSYERGYAVGVAAFYYTQAGK